MNNKTLAEQLEDFEDRPQPGDWLNIAEADNAHVLYTPMHKHEDILDALAEHCGIQWGNKRPIAQQIVRHFYDRIAVPYQEAIHELLELKPVTPEPVTPEKEEPHHEDHD